MKAICPRESLLSACQLASVAVPSRDIKPILRNIKAIGTPTGCTLMATDLEFGVRLEVRGMKVEDAGEAILPAARLITILREAPDAELTLEATETATLIRGQFNEFEMPGEDPAEFPDIPKFTDEKYHEVAGQVLRDMVRRTIFAVARESVRYSMTGVLWEFTDTQVKLVATDGRRLAVATGASTSHGASATAGQTHVVPTKAMSLLERLLQDGEETVKISLKPNEALFKTERAMIYTRLVEGRYPSYQEVIPKKTPVKVPLEAATFQSAVRQAAIMTDEESKRVVFGFTKHKLTLKAQGAESGRSKVEMPVEYDSKDLTISFDAQFVIDMLKVLPADVALSLDLVDAATPAVFRSGPEYLYVVMPLT